MSSSNIFMRFAALAALAAYLLAGPANAASTKAGVASSMKNDVERLTNNLPQPLKAGGDVFTGDVVKTGKTGGAQLMLLDQTNLAIAPGSSVTIDKFVYDPDGTSGAVVITVAKGTVRFITGAQDPRNYVINTPIATIGVHGTILNIVATDDSLLVVLGDGKAFVVGKDGKKSEMEAKGNLVIIGPDGKATNEVNGSLKEAVAALIAGADDPAAMAAQILVAVGAAGDDVTQDNMQDIASAISNANIDPEKFSDAVGDMVLGAVDAGSTTTDILKTAAHLDGGLKTATGKGLAKAAEAVGILEPGTAAVIEAAVESSDIPEAKDGYTQQRTGDSTKSTKGTGEDDNGNLPAENNDTPTPPVSPN